MKLALLFLINIGVSLGVAQDFNSHGFQWTYEETIKAYKLIVLEKDFSSIDQAFALREPDLLFELYFKAEGNKFGAKNHNPALADIPVISSDEQRRLLNLEVKKRILERLRQLPNLARYIGDGIESSANIPHADADFFHGIQRLTILGNDDSIVQLGRFLFDGRNPGARIQEKGGHRRMYETSDIKNYVAGALIGMLRNVPGIAAEIKATPKGAPGYEKKAQDWWLNSPEAAPYRQKLAALGVKLPPGYPPMAELGT